MSGLNTQNIMDDILRGVAISAVNRLVWTRQPVFSAQTINEGFRFGMASITYSVVAPMVRTAIPQLSPLLPNGN